MLQAYNNQTSFLPPPLPGLLAPPVVSSTGGSSDNTWQIAVGVSVGGRSVTKRLAVYLLLPCTLQLHLPYPTTVVHCAAPPCSALPRLSHTATSSPSASCWSRCLAGPGCVAGL